jgi:hypothetical protein
MDAETRGRFQPGGWKQYDLLMLRLSIATILWILVSH